MMEKLTLLSGQELMSYGNNGLSAGGNVYFGPNNYYDYYHYYYPAYYPQYHLIESKSKIEQSFKIVEKLLENKLIIKELTVREFMKIVNEIAKVI